MIKAYLIRAAVMVLFAVPFLFGCGSDGASSSGTTGRLSLRITDAPVDGAEAVYITFTQVSLQGVEGSQDQGPFPIEQTQQLINLMEFQGTDSEVLVTDLEVPAGTYKLGLDPDVTFDETEQRSWIAFSIDSEECDRESAVVSQDGLTCRLPFDIPSGEQSGFKPKGEVTITAGGNSRFTVEFDLRKNVLDPQNDDFFRLKPTGLRLVNDTEVGSISGTVAEELTEGQCVPTDAKVYLFERGDGAEPFVADDMHEDNEALVTSVSVKEDEETAEYEYTIGFVPTGMYALALTCETDDPTEDEEIAFLAEADAILVSVDQETTQDLPANEE